MLIKILFPPKFMFKYVSLFDAEHKKEHQLGYTSSFTVSKEKIEEILKSDVAVKDISRTAWQIDKQKQILGEGAMEALETRSKVTNNLKKPINLSRDEVRALFALSMWTGNETLQGGIYGTPKIIIGGLWLIFHAITGLELGNYQLKRTGRGLQVVADIFASKVTLNDAYKRGLESFTFDNQSQQAILIKYPIQIIAQQDGSYSVFLDNKNYEFKMDEFIWDKYVLVGAKKRLLDKKKLDLDSLFTLIPCLLDKEFTQSFSKRLQTESLEIQETAAKLIVACFEDHPKELKRITASCDKKMQEFISVNKIKNQCQIYIDDFQKQCEKHISYLDKLNKNESAPYNKRWYASEKISVLQELNKILKDNTLSEDVKFLKFAGEFNRKESVFERGGDKKSIKFLKAIGHILASAATLGIYAGVRAYYSNKKYGSAKFWKSKDEMLVEKSKKAIKTIDEIEHKSNNKPTSK